MQFLSTFPTAFAVRIIVYSYLIYERWKLRDEFLQDFSSDTKKTFLACGSFSMEMNRL